MKKFSAALATALLVTCMGVGVALLASCSNSSESPAATPAAPTTPTNTETPTTPAAPGATTYTVTFDTDGGSAVDSQTVTSGQKATKPSPPTKTDGSINYFFVGWYNGNVFYDFNSAVSADITLTAKWFVKVAAGTYDGSAALTPASEVFIVGRNLTIPALYVCDHEVTQGEYETYCKYGNTTPIAADKGAGTNFPAYYVSWYDAAIYCNLRTIAEFGGEDQCVYTLNGKAHPKDWPGIVGNAADKYCGPSTTTDDWDYKGGSDVGIKFDPTKKGYRLPTEAEWEYIARNKNADSFTYSGSDAIGEVAWYLENSNGKTHKIKTASKANGLGIYDMSGNVYEWCHDWYDDITASTGPLGGAPSESRRVNRGGCWYSNDGNCSVAWRDVIYPHYRHYNIGFRVVRTAQ